MILNFKQQIRKGNLKGWQTNFANKIKDGVKVHTIRPDEKDRWKAGNKIHFAAGPYKKGRVFYEAVCTSVQTIQIRWINIGILPLLIIVVDGRRLGGLEIAEFALNDGFPDTEQFMLWDDWTFSKSFKGKLIHWTDLKY